MQLEPKRLPMAWTTNVKDDAKAELEQLIRNSTTVLSRFRDIILERLEALERTEMSSDFFDKPNPTSRFEFNLGRKKELHDLLRLLTI